MGGWLADRTASPRGCILGSYLASAAVTVYLSFQFLGTGAAGLTVTLFVWIYLFYNLAYGVQQGSSTGMYMQLSSKAVAATQFTGFMALANLSLTYSSAWQGKIVDAHGYPYMFQMDALLGLTGLLILPLLKPKKHAVQTPASITVATSQAAAEAASAGD